MDLPTVLHVEPAEDDRILVERIHRRHAPPSRLVQFGSPSAARLALDGGLKPALVLVAAGVEPETGETFARWFRSRHGGHARMFLLTGNVDPDVTHRALSAGADGVIYRTSDIGRMAAALTAVFEAHLSPT